MELLAQAGYPKGFKTKIIYRTIDLAEYYTAVQGYLKDVGIDVELEPVTMARWSQIINTGWDNALVAWYLPIGIGSEPGQFLLRNFANSAALYKNIVRNEKIDTIIAKALAEPDVRKRSVLYRGMTALINDTYAIVCPVYIGYALSAQTLRVHDMTITSIGVIKLTPQDAWLSR